MLIVVFILLNRTLLMSDLSEIVPSVLHLSPFSEVV